MISYRQADYEDFIDSTTEKVYRFAMNYIENGEYYNIRQSSCYSMPLDTFRGGENDWKPNGKLWEYMRNELQGPWVMDNDRMYWESKAITVHSQLMLHLDPEFQYSGNEPHKFMDAWYYTPSDTSPDIIFKSPMIDEAIR